MLNTMRCLTCDYADDDPSLVLPDDQHLAGFVPLERSCLAQLRRIIHATGAHIVLSTTWRLEPAMRAFLLQALDVSGIGRGAVVGDTPAMPGAGRGQRHLCFSGPSLTEAMAVGTRHAACARSLKATTSM